MCSKGELQQKKLLKKIQERKKMFKNKKHAENTHHHGVAPFRVSGLVFAGWYFGC